jgi:hypothetical protein
MSAKAPPQFRQCHLKILRSLYAEESSVSVDDTGSKVKCGRPSQRESQTLEQHGATSKETTVSSKIWDLIQQFIHQRSDYRPHKQRQTHWTQLHAESQTRLEHLSYISLERQESNKKSAQKRRATPSRTPLLNMIKRPGTPLSLLTPLSSNKAEIMSAAEHEITSWTFINSMINKRAQLCTSSCEEFRAQSFLGELYTECGLRVEVLKAGLEHLKTHDKKEHPVEPLAKRQKTDATRFYFFRDYNSIDAHSSEDATNKSNSDELINETQIKLCLWSNLLASVKEIVDEK